MKKILAIAIATAISAPAMADMTITADIETNSTVASNADFAQAGRVAVAIAGKTTADNGMYVSAKTTQEFGLDANQTQTDTYIEVGNADANVKLGYVRDPEVWAQPGDVYIADTGVAAGYQGGALRGRDANNVILTANAGPAVVTASARDVNGVINMRYTAAAALGSVNLSAAFEDSNSASTDALNDASSGYVVNVNTVIAGSTVGASFAESDADANAFDVYGTMGSLTLGAKVTEDAPVSGSQAKETAYYAAYAIADLAGVAGLKATLAASVASDNSTTTDDVSGARLRLNYAF
jgi:hypothetical protein